MQTTAQQLERKQKIAAAISEFHLNVLNFLEMVEVSTGAEKQRALSLAADYIYARHNKLIFDAAMLLYLNDPFIKEAYNDYFHVHLWLVIGFLYEFYPALVHTSRDKFNDSFLKLLKTLGTI